MTDWAIVEPNRWRRTDGGAVPVRKKRPARSTRSWRLRWAATTHAPMKTPHPARNSATATMAPGTKSHFGPSAAPRSEIASAAVASQDARTIPRPAAGSDGACSATAPTVLECGPERLRQPRVIERLDREPPAVAPVTGDGDEQIGSLRRQSRRGADQHIHAFARDQPAYAHDQPGGYRKAEDAARLLPFVVRHRDEAAGVDAGRNDNDGDPLTGQDAGAGCGVVASSHDDRRARQHAAQP